MRFKPMALLVQTARVQPAQALPDEMHQSWPIPVLAADGLRAAFLFAPRNLDRERGQVLFPPTYLAQIDAASGRFLELRAITPAELGQADAPGDVLGSYALPEGVDAQRYLALEADTLRALDALVESFADDARPTDPSFARVAADFSRLYWALTAAPLHRYYRAVGRRFFGWLDGVAA